MLAGVNRMSDAGECVRCHARLPALAAFCNRCGITIERKSQVAVPNDLRTLADRHRQLVRVFLFFLLEQLLLVILRYFPVPEVAVVAAVMWVVLVVALMVSALSLAGALHFGVLISVLLTILCLVPLVNLFVVSWLARRAATELRLSGIRVGFFGAEKNALDIIAYEHRCRSCGYDLRGLTSLKCPECGVAFSAPLAASPIV